MHVAYLALIIANHNRPGDPVETHFAVPVNSDTEAMVAYSEEKKVLVLQGGGALGAYQGGAYEALAEAGIEPDWVAGISIGAINSAIIAGNPPEQRVPRFAISGSRFPVVSPDAAVRNDDNSRKLFNETSAALSAAGGAPGFFEPRIPPAVVMPQGTSASDQHLRYRTSPSDATPSSLTSNC